MSTAVQSFNWVTAIQTWFLVVLAIGAAGFMLGVLLAGRARGSLVDGFVAAGNRAFDLVRDLVALSPRRVWAIAWHSMLESIRRRMLLAVFAVFVVLFLFAGWYLPSDRPMEQVKVYVSFVMLSSTLIAMLASGLLACLSLPSDIRDKTIHTVVTKPVRRLEIVIGRILGLTIVATATLVVMGGMSYVYLSRSVNGSLDQLRHELAAAEQKGDVERQEQIKDSIEQIESRMTARVAIYGALTGEFKNVGHETIYRGYIEGNKTDVAAWHFKNVPVERLLAQKPAALPVEMTFTVFRTTKGELGHGVIAQITYKNPRTGVEITDDPFEMREYYVNRRILSDSPKKSLAQLFQGCDGELEIDVRCLSSSQYLGMAPPDLYILLDKASFGLNFAKGLVGVWIRVLLIICVAVMFSTFLSSYVAMMATASVFAGGMCMPFLRGLAFGQVSGGGPLEALIRLWMHENLQRPLELGFWARSTQAIDAGLRMVLRGLTYVLPDLGTFNMAPLVANGFDIAGMLMVQNLVAALAYAVPLTIAGYFLLQAREIAR